MPIFNNMLGGAAGSGGAAGYEIERSLRFDSGSGGYLSKNFGSAGNRKTWTASFWTKRCINNTSFYQSFLINRDNASYNLRIDPASASTTAYKFYFNFASGVNFTTTQVFRDPSAWMHVVVVYDSRATTTSTDRLKLYINGERVTAFDAINYPGDDVLSEFNNSNNYGIGYFNANTALDGYLADYHFIDGQALAESDFGEYDDNGVWQPKAYSGTYGTNGFHLDFSDNSNNDALGYDANGTVRYWPDVTGTNISSTVKNLFDGSTTTAVDGTAGTTITFTPSTPIPYSSSVEVYTASGATERTYSLNGGTGVTNVANGWTSLATGSGTITSISNTPNSNYYQSWSAIRVDGVILTDPNDWTVNNLTANRSEPYAHMWSGTFLAGEPGENAFDGSTITAARPDSSQTITWTHPTGIPFTQLSMRAAKSGAGTNITVNGVDVTETFNPQTTADLSSVITSPLTTISLTSTASERPKLMYVAIDGTALVSGHNTDVFIDSPTNYEADSGNNGGNYATFNSVNNTAVLEDGNLVIKSPAGTHSNSYATMGITNGKFYWEVTKNATTSTVGVIGFHGLSSHNTPKGTSYSDPGANADQKAIYLTANAIVCNARGLAATGHVLYASGSPALPSGWITDAGTYMFCVDMDNQEAWIGKDGVWWGSTGSAITTTGGDPANRTNPLWLLDADDTYFPFLGPYGTSVGQTTFTANFGQRPFAYAAPSGFKALCTTNLPDPTIADGSTAMDVSLWTGNSAARDITGFDMSPDLVWIKKRNSSTFGSHHLFDTVRGATQALVCNDKQQEQTEATQLTAFNSDGFSLGTSPSSNATGDTYVAWAWDAGTSKASNTDGTITSSVRANQTAGFSIVSYTGTGAAQTTGHGLNATPAFVILKNRDTGSTHWQVFGDGFERLQLSTTGAELTDGYTLARTSTTISPTGNSVTNNQMNANGDDYIAYCFAPVEGYSAFGSYTGNSSSDGTFIYTGFRPAFVLIKTTNTASSWYVYDSGRETYNAADTALFPNLNNAESTNTAAAVDFVSNGFKLRGNAGATNSSSNTYIYAAFAENPFKTARAR
jgi:hypothetical protein